MYPLLAVVSGKGAQLEPAYDGDLSAELLVMESSTGVSLTPVALQITPNSPSIASAPTIFSMALLERPPERGFILTAMTNLFVNTPPATTTLDIIEDFSTQQVSWNQTSPVTTVNNRLAVAYNTESSQLNATIAFYDTPDTTKQDAVGVMIYYKVNTGVVNFVSASRPTPTFGKQITVDISSAPLGSWAIVTVQHQYALVTPNGWVADVRGVINGDHPDTPIDKLGHGLTVYRKKITQDDLDIGLVSFRTVGSNVPTLQPKYTVQAGEPLAQSGEPTALSGNYTTLKLV